MKIQDKGEDDENSVDEIAVIKFLLLKASYSQLLNFLF